MLLWRVDDDIVAPVVINSHYFCVLVVMSLGIFTLIKL